MKTIPIHLSDANKFVKRYHRHNLPTVGGKFAIAAEKNGVIVGVAIAGRPVARALDDGKTVEIIRVATNETKNATSFLYAKMRRICQLMGYSKIITYTLTEESGASLRAIGATVEKELSPAEWDCPSRRRKSQRVYTQYKLRWEL